MAHNRLSECRLFDSLGRQGWFEAPINATYIFMLPTDVTSTLTWSGNNNAMRNETLAAVVNSSAPPVLSPSVDMSSTYQCATRPCTDDSSNTFRAARCIDGNIDGNICHSSTSATAGGEWLSIKLSD